MQSTLQAWEDSHTAHGKRHASPICLQQSLDILKNMLIRMLVRMYYEFINYFLQNCIGAIDGTQIDAEVRGMSAVPYRSRKKKATQNVMCVVDMDLCFTYVYAGWERSAHDSRMSA
jgi:hypothetical protein